MTGERTSLLVQSLHCKQFPSYKPSIVGYFSVDGERNYIPTGINCKYVKMPKAGTQVQFDLNDGYQFVIKKPPSAANEKLDHLLTFISQNLSKLRNHDDTTAQKLNADIVCFRGLLRLLMCTPYEDKDGWSILATRYQGTIYLCAHESDENRQNRESQTDQLKKILSYGFKFEQYIMSDDPNVEPRSDTPVNESEEFCCMFSSKLDECRLLFGAEMDGIESDKIDIETTDLNSLNFVELKVNRRPLNKWNEQSFLRYKLRNWWCQCYLVGVSRMIVGQRTDSGVVDELEVLDINRECKKAVKFWSPSVCLDFCSSFLKLVQREMKGINCSQTVYQFNYHPKKMKAVEMIRMQSGNPYTFLPGWYVELLNK